MDNQSNVVKVLDVIYDVKNAIGITRYDSANDDYLQFYDEASNVRLSQVISMLQDVLLVEGDLPVYQLSEGRDIDSGMRVILTSGKITGIIF